MWLHTNTITGSGVYINRQCRELARSLMLLAKDVACSATNGRGTHSLQPSHWPEVKGRGRQGKRACRTATRVKWDSGTMLIKQRGIMVPIRNLEDDKKGSTRPREKGGLPKW